MFFKKTRKEDAQIPTGALPDIIFLLLIFFLITTYIDQEKGLSLVLPSFDETPVDDKNIARLLINPQGQLLLDNEQISITQLSSIVRERIDKNPNLILSILPDKRAKYDSYIDVLDRLKKAGAKKISISNP
jgi:biopolymer transport protein ExbD